MIEYKNEKISVMELVPNDYEGYDVSGEGLDFNVNSTKVIYQASSENYGLAFAQAPQDAVDLVKNLIDQDK